MGQGPASSLVNIASSIATIALGATAAWLWTAGRWPLVVWLPALLAVGVAAGLVVRVALLRYR